MSPWLSNPYFGSKSRIQPIASGSAGKKKESQKKNSRNPFIGISVRAINQAKKQPSTRAIDCRVIASVNVLVMAFTIPGVVNALTQPSTPQRIG